MKLRVVIIVILLTTLAFIASANESLFYKEINLIGGYSSRDHWLGKYSELANSIGFEDYRKFSNDYGDFLTTDLQMRLIYDSLEGANDAFGVQIHNAWVKYKVHSGLNIIGGHFDPNFGLEPQIDTHSSLLQTLMMKDLGFKKDWGIGIEGQKPKFDYKLALQAGSGMSFYRRNGSYLISGRIGTPSTQNFQLGLSALYGDVLNYMGLRTFPRDDLMSDTATTKKRIGVDGQYLFGPYLFKSEISFGENDDTKVIGYLGEIDYTVPKFQNWEVQLQFQSWINDLGSRSSDDSTITLGTSYKLSQNTTLRAAFVHELNTFGMKEDNKFIFQYYYFGF